MLPSGVKQGLLSKSPKLLGEGVVLQQLQMETCNFQKYIAPKLFLLLYFIPARIYGFSHDAFLYGI